MVGTETFIKIFKKISVEVWKTEIIITRKLLSCSSNKNFLKDRYLKQELLAISQRLPLSLLLNLSINPSKRQCLVYI